MSKSKRKPIFSRKKYLADMGEQNAIWDWPKTCNGLTKDEMNNRGIGTCDAWMITPRPAKRVRS